jgi:hypothetical protein
VSVETRKRNAVSFDDFSIKPEPSFPTEKFCINAALAYIHLRTAVNLTKESLQNQSLVDMRNHLLHKGEYYVQGVVQSEKIKCAFASILYSLKFDTSNIDEEELEVLDVWSR